jgi:two-component system phosphate regulon sensor histidine kinase PhoR
MLYAAIPLKFPDNHLSENTLPSISVSIGPEAMTTAGGQTARAAVLRLALPLPLLMERARESRLLLAVAAILSVLAALTTSAILMRMLARPITVLAEKARLYPSNPDMHRPFGSRIAMDRLPREFSILGQALDTMAADLSRQTREAQDLGRRYATILESAGEGILAVDGSLRITEANPASQELLGQSGNALIGRGLSSIAGAESLATLARRCMESGKPEDGEILLLGSERERSIQAKATSLAQQPGKPGESRGAVLAFSDITMLKRLERVRSDFVSNVSHELRTPIHLIRGFSETAKAELESPSPGTDERLAHYLDIIEKHALRMERIVADLLSLARLERDSSTWLSMELCDTAAILAEVVDTCSQQAKAKAISLETRLPCAFSLQANRGLIEQALINLVENAIRYSPESSVITLEASTEAHHAIFRVIDHGSGIPEPALTRIFERFYRVDKARDRKSGGTGLGLAIVRHIALAHGGEAHAQSWAGEGSIFTIRIPLKGTELMAQDSARTGHCD